MANWDHKSNIGTHPDIDGGASNTLDSQVGTRSELSTPLSDSLRELVAQLRSEAEAIRPTDDRDENDFDLDGEHDEDLSDREADTLIAVADRIEAALLRA